MALAVAVTLLAFSYFDPRLLARRPWYLVAIIGELLVLGIDSWQTWSYVAKYRGWNMVALAEWLKYTWVDWLSMEEMARKYLETCKADLAAAETRLTQVTRASARLRKYVIGLEVRLHKKLDRAGYVKGTPEYPIHDRAVELLNMCGENLAFRYVDWACAVRPLLNRLHRRPLDASKQEVILELLSHADQRGLEALAGTLESVYPSYPPPDALAMKSPNADIIKRRRLTEIEALVLREQYLPEANRSPELTTLRERLLYSADPELVRGRNYRIARYAYEQAILAAEESGRQSVRA